MAEPLRCMMELLGHEEYDCEEEKCCVPEHFVWYLRLEGREELIDLHGFR